YPHPQHLHSFPTRRSSDLQLSPSDAARRGVEAVEELAHDIQIPKGLGKYGVHPSHIPQIIDEAMKSGNVVVNPRPTSREQLAARSEEHTSELQSLRHLVCR